MPIIIGPTRRIILQDPDDSRDYLIDTTELFAGDPVDSATLITSNITATADISVADFEVEDYGIIPAGRAVTLWVSGGQVGLPGKITLRLESGSRRMDLTYNVVLKQA